MAPYPLPLGKRDLYIAKMEEAARASPPIMIPTFVDTVTNREN